MDVASSFLVAAFLSSCILVVIVCALPAFIQAWFERCGPCSIVVGRRLVFRRLRSFIGDVHNIIYNIRLRACLRAGLPFHCASSSGAVLRPFRRCVFAFVRNVKLLFYRLVSGLAFPIRSA